VRREVVNGKWASIIGLLLAASACSGQCGPTAKTPVKTTPLAAVPSTSPTPTTPLQASSSPFHGGEVGVAYGPVSLSASGGVAPYMWSLNTGALPGGLTLGPDGSVSGTPTSAGSFSFTIQVADAGDSTANIPGTIGIAPALTAGLIASCAQYCNVELGCVNACGSFGQQSGGVGPYTYAVTQGPLPSGTSLNGLSLNGTFKGTSGWLQFTVQVGDAFGATASLSPKFWMYDHVSLASGACYGNYNTGCSASLSISSGVPGTSRSVKLLGVGPNPNQGCWSSTATAPPAGYGLAVNGSNVVVSIPNRIINGYGAVWTIQVDEQTPCSSAAACTSNQATVVIGVQCG
jgi:putative Ig domain-containing protein